MTSSALVLREVGAGLWREFASHVPSVQKSVAVENPGGSSPACAAPPEVDGIVSRRDGILAHWRRALALGASLEGPPPEDRLLRGAALDEHIERTELVRHLAAADLQRAASDVSAREFVLLLADATGVVVSTSGGGEFSDEARRVRLIPGASWSEGARGTNAIGTAIAERRPVFVRGSAHLGRRFHELVCYAAPIFDADGTLLAVVDATGRFTRADDAIGSEVVRTADVIMQALRDRAFARAGSALRQTLARALDRMQGIALLVEPPERVTRMNAGARVLFGAPHGSTPQALLGLDLARLAAEARAPRGLELERTGQRYRVRVEPIGSDAAPIALLVFLEPGSARCDPPRPAAASGGRPAAASPGVRAGASALAFGSVFSSDPDLDEALSLARRIAPSPLPVLLLAETGSGKELVARAIHAHSPRRDAPFIAVNCGAIAPSLLESELFGYAPAAFTGAERRGRQGLFAAASGGSVFLDEVAEMTPAMQAALLRVLEDGTFRRVGEVIEQHTDVRVISATCLDLKALVDAGRFRRDLFYRLEGARVTLPPLRARSDRAALAAHLLQALAQRRGVLPAPQLSPEVLELFERHDWPGNVRELQTVLDVSLVLAAGDPVIALEHLPPEFRRGLSATTAPGRSPAAGDAAPGDLLAVESTTVRRALLDAGNNVTVAAKRLGVARSTLYRMKRRHRL